MVVAALCPLVCTTARHSASSDQPHARVPRWVYPGGISEKGSNTFWGHARVLSACTTSQTRSLPVKFAWTSSNYRRASRYANSPCCRPIEHAFPQNVSFHVKILSNGARVKNGRESLRKKWIFFLTFLFYFSSFTQLHSYHVYLKILNSISYEILQKI